jgi:TolB-like protein/class 3 adenylate cyclase/Flp pilus assembly protein TadD
MEQEQPIRVGRRLAAIVAADVAGYSRLMGIDEVGTARTLREHRKVTDALVAKHGGRLVKTTGDGVLLEFPSVVDAVECAVAVQAVMAERNKGLPEDRRMLFRIGINLGDILIEDDDILGDGVNVAARLEGIAEPGGICVSSSAYEQVRGKVAVDFTDLGEQHLKNIFLPVRAYAVFRDGVGGKKKPNSAMSSPGSAPRLSIVVLPFANIGGGPEQDYFVDGVTESLTTDLSRIGGSFVIARNTAFTFKGRAVDVKQIGRDLNVRYAVEGSMQRGSNRVRVNVQLIDTETGKHLWAERFDKPIADLFEMQDEIVSRLANALDTELVVAEAQRAEHLLSPDAVDFYFQGRACLNRAQTPQSLMETRGFFERALALDAKNVEALVGLSIVDTIIGYAVMSGDRKVHLSAAETALAKALAMSPNHALAHATLGAVQIVTDRVLQGIAECQRALELDHNLAAAHALIGHAKHHLGRSAETEAHVNDAVRLSPRDAFLPWWINWVGFSKFALEDYVAAASCFQRSIEVNRNNSYGHLGLATTLVQLGRLVEAKATLQHGLALDPHLTLSRLRSNTANLSSASLRGRERFLEGLRIAGMCEG